MDFSFNRGTSSSLTPNGDLSKLLSASPANKRAYYGHLKDIIDTSFNTGYLSRWASHYSCFLPSENLGTHLGYINSRRNYALSAINAAVSEVPFRITTPTGTTTSEPFIEIRGDAWVDVREIRLTGASEPLSLTWIDDNRWQVDIPVNPGLNQISLQALDFRGNTLSTRNISITGTSSLAPASASNLAISEIMYHPGSPTDSESRSGWTDQDDFEFIELVNLSKTRTLDLTGLRFVNGIDYQFPSSTLAPGARALIAGREPAFIARYGSEHPVIGSYQNGNNNKLANRGERLVLMDASGIPIADLTWSHDNPWPASADGDGYSLILMCPELNDPTLPTSWRTSASPGGNPGSSDAIKLEEWQASENVTDLFSDTDNDGLPALLEYAGGQNPDSPETKGLVSITLEDSGTRYPVISFHQRIGADNVSFSAEQSRDLLDWRPGPLYLGRINNGDGTSSVLFRATQSTSTEPSRYLRIIASENRR
jgi:hypothetical protein